MEKGDRVIATVDIEPGFFDPKVAKGTKGVVTDITEEGVFSSAKVAVTFENGQRLEVDPEQVAKA